MAYVKLVSMPVNTCVAVKCETCEKITWKGCGNHVDEVMKTVDEGAKCQCPRG